MKKIKRLISALVVLCMAAMPIMTSAASMGVSVVPTTGANTVLEKVINADVEWVRVEMRWEDFEKLPYYNNGVKGELETPEDIKNEVIRYNENGIKTLALLCFGNRNYADGQIEYAYANTTKSGAMPMVVENDAEAEEYLNAFLDYVAEVANEMGDYIDAYEVWNEPNLQYFNANLFAEDEAYRSNGTNYAKLYLKVRDLIHSLDPTATVMACSVTGWAEGDFADTQRIGAKTFVNDFMAQMAAMNAVDKVDALSIHMYSNSLPALGHEVFDDIKAYETSYCFGGSLWVTEFGTSSVEGDTENGVATGVTVTEQAEKALIEAMIFSAGVNYLSNKSGQFLRYTLRDNATGDTSDYGALDYFYTEKPVYKALQTYNRTVAGLDFAGLADGNDADGLWTHGDRSGTVAKYTDGVDTTFLAACFDGFWEDTANFWDKLWGNSNYELTYTNPSVSYTFTAPDGTEATIYKPDGTVVQTFTGNTTYTLTTEPVIVECRTPNRTRIDRFVYSEDTEVVTVVGRTNAISEGESITLYVDNEAKATALVGADGEFRAQLQLEAEDNVKTVAIKAKAGVDGELVEEENLTIPAKKTVSGNKIVLTGSDAKWAKSKPQITLTGTSTGTEPLATIIVCPADATASVATAAHVGEVNIVNGQFTYSFEMKDGSEGNYKVYLASKNADKITNDALMCYLVIANENETMVTPGEGYTVPNGASGTATVFVDYATQSIYRTNETATVIEDTTYVEATTDNDGVNIVNGAQVRIGGGVDSDGKINEVLDGSGLRFIGTVDYNDTLAALSDNEELNGKVEFGIALRPESSSLVYYIPAEKFQDSSKNVFTVALTNLLESNYNRVFSACTYVKIWSASQIDENGNVKDGEEPFILMDNTSKVDRSIYQVAAGLLKRGYTDENGTSSDKGDTDYTAMSDILIKVLNAYVNQTGIRLAFSDDALVAHDINSTSDKGGKYSAEAFFTVGETTVTNNADGTRTYSVELTTGKNTEVKMNEISTSDQSGTEEFWRQYIRINNNNSSAKVAVTLSLKSVDETTGEKTYTLTFTLDGNNKPVDVTE